MTAVQAGGGAAAPRIIRVQQATSNRFILLLVKILLVLVILLLLPRLVKARSKLNHKKMKQRRKNRVDVVLADTREVCEYYTCIQFLAEEAMNCVQLCISPACYQEIYGDNPLEDGEIDIDRAKTFEICVKNEMREVRKRQRSDPALFGL